MLIDRVELTVKAGKGGDGIVAWRREKFVPKGGPDGGDGGKGGDVIVEANHNLDTLSHFRFQKSWSAKDGDNGSNKQKSGKKGEDLILKVPVGTKIFDAKDSNLIADMTQEGQKLLLAKGGKGGFGNTHFAHSTQQHPSFATGGETGEKKQIILQLELIADGAIVGPPNSGKSSLIKALTGVEARIGAYPFSTTDPLLGVMNFRKNKITLLDLPGLIEKAHQGKGLGDKFLQHLHRVSFIIYLLDGSDEPAKNYTLLREEISQYESELLRKDNLVVINKSDLLASSERRMLKKLMPNSFIISTQTGEGLDRLKLAVTNLYRKIVQAKNEVNS